MKIVDHQEAAFQQIFAQPLRFRVGERPVRHLHGIDPGIVEDLVALQVDDLFGRTHLDPREALQRQQELPIRLGIVTRPVAVTEPAVAVPTAAAKVAGRVSQSRPVELRLLAGTVVRNARIVFLSPGNAQAIESQQSTAQTAEQGQKPVRSLRPHMSLALEGYGQFVPQDCVRRLPNAPCNHTAVGLLVPAHAWLK